MKLSLHRKPSISTCTHGDLYVDGEWQCVTLEDVVRAEKISGNSAIPAGTYRIEITHSPRFNRDLPLLIGVPCFTGVRIHSGNSSKDTEGCILVGTDCPDPAKDWITNSRVAFGALFDKLVMAKDDVSIEIIDA